MDIILFEQYLREKYGMTSTQKHYLTGIRKVNAFLAEHPGLFSSADITTITTETELERLRAALYADSDFMALDARGNRMYTSAFKQYCEFALGEAAFKKIEIARLDVPRHFDSGFIRQVTVTRIERDAIMVGQVLRAADYQCEADPSHQTFTREGTDHAYMEGHHLIPLSAQKNFSVKLDCYADIVCLCPVCHRLLHYGERKAKSRLFDRLFEARQVRLENSGIFGSCRELRELAINGLRA